MKFGDKVENTYASKDNPRKYSFFIRKVKQTGRLNPGLFAECTDGKGKVWRTAFDAIKLVTPSEQEPV